MSGAEAPSVGRTLRRAPAPRLRAAGVAGAGGAGFPAYPKWADADELQYLLLNHQESEPNFYADRWHLREHAEEYADFFRTLLAEVLDVVVVGAKLTDRDRWLREFERAADATVYRPDELPLDPGAESGVVVAYTEDRYQFGMENVLLGQVAGVNPGRDLPGDYGWVVQNTETMYDAYRALTHGLPVTRKRVHVDGPDVAHRLFDVPVGTPVAELLDAAGLGPAVPEGQTLVHGGPGWGFDVGGDADGLVVRKHTNGILVEDADVVERNTLGNGRVSLRDARDWTAGDHETEPTTLAPDAVRVPSVTNDDYDAVVGGDPAVAAGDRVSTGQTVVRPAREGVSVAHHAPVDGTVTAVDDDGVRIERD